jgi:hypothetical protein
MEPHNLQHQKKTNWDTFTFNTSTYLDNDEQLNLQHQKKQTVGILLLSTTLLAWDNEEVQPHSLQHQKSGNCWDTCFQHYLMTLG